MRIRHRSRDTRMMTEGPILKQIIYFSIPLLIGNIFQQLYNTVDSIVVGNFVGATGLAAVGSTSSIISTLVGVFSGLATGGTVVISQYYGAQDRKNLQSAVHTTVMMVLIMSVLFTILGMAATPLMLDLMDTPADVYDQAKEYLLIYFGGLSGLMVYNIGAGILRAVGDSRRPLYFLLVSCVINIVLDLLFVISFDMGVAGVGYATIIAQFVSAILVMLVLMNTHGEYRLFLKKLRMDMPIFRRIISIGAPAALQTGVTSFSNVFVQGYINAFGSACMAGWSAFLKVDQFVALPLQSIAIAATTFMGQNVGAKKMDRAKKGARSSLMLGLGVISALIVMMMIFARPLVSMFNSDPDVLRYGAMFIRCIGVFGFLSCINQIYAGILRGLGDSKGPMIIFLGCFVAFRQVYLYIMSRVYNHYLAIGLGYPAGWVIAAILISVYYHKRMKVHLKQTATLDISL